MQMTDEQKYSHVVVRVLLAVAKSEWESDEMEISSVAALPWTKEMGRLPLLLMAALNMSFYLGVKNIVEAMRLQ